MTALREGLPPLPDRMKSLPLDHRGYPVPYFVQWIDGVPHFPVMDSRKRQRAQRFNLCWVCGQTLGVHQTYVLGPMCTISRTTSEPANHYECALFSARGCPFLIMPKMKRNEAAYPEGAEMKAPGIMVDRNPGVMALWTQRGQAKAFNVPKQHGGGWLLQVGEPERVSWWREGRSATRAEVLAAFESGLPTLYNVEVSDEAHAELRRQEEIARKFLPDA